MGSWGFSVLAMSLPDSLLHAEKEDRTWKAMKNSSRASFQGTGAESLLACALFFFSVFLGVGKDKERHKERLGRFSAPFLMPFSHVTMIAHSSDPASLQLSQGKTLSSSWLWWVKLNGLFPQTMRTVSTFVCLDVNIVKQTWQVLGLGSRDLLYYVVQFE